MPLNLLKEYSDLLELVHLDENGRTKSLKGIFKRDIEDNSNFKFENKIIRPLAKSDGASSMEILFTHLTTEVDYSHEFKKRIFELDRSKRLHWLKFHLEKSSTLKVHVFSIVDRINGRNYKRTYIYNKEEKYVIILELQRSSIDYYLITAYYLNKKEGVKQIEQKLKNKLQDIF